MKPVIRVFAAFFVLALFIGSAHLIRASYNGAPDFPDAVITATSAEVILDIPAGATGSEIAALAAGKGVVKSSEALFRVFVGDKRAERIAPGAHRLTLKISARQALEQLLDHDRIPGLIQIFEGEWNSEVISSLEKNGFDVAEIKAALAQAQLPRGFTSVEGLLFPAAYSFERDTPIGEIINAMVERGTKELSSVGILSSQDRYSPQQLLTIASIIQQEGDVQDFGKISRVIRNRLEIGMRLQLDSTVHFIKRTRGSVFLSTRSTLISSPFNTYQRYGLPPTPIGNPGRAALEAALKPEKGPWLYFITVKPGDTRFTDSLDEFNGWKAEYKKNLRAGAFS